MIEEYIFKTVISFISLKSALYLTEENWLKLNPKRNGFIKRNFNALVFLFNASYSLGMGNSCFSDRYSFRK